MAGSRYEKNGRISSYLAVPSICLGTFDLTVKEITKEYSTFVNKGVYTEARFLSQKLQIRMALY